MMDPKTSLDIASLRAAYGNGRLKAGEMAELIRARIEAGADKAVWISLRDPGELQAEAEALDRRKPEELPLFGIPFAVKDNIDVAGMTTTAACPEFAYVADRTATAVRRLQDAGALLIGKTNLDQFATGLVGVRSPYGAPRSAFDARYISGGSSSGSAVAVASSLVSFALGTDTAGSGRVPAAFNNLIGMKPSRGLLSAAGVVPACRSLDCPSIFALTAGDAAQVLAVAGGFDPLDAYSRDTLPLPPPILKPFHGRLRFAVPRAGQLEFFDGGDWPELFAKTVERLIALGGDPVEIDFSPFIETARLLYDGPWVAERYAAVGAFLEAHPQAGHPTVRRIIEGGRDIPAHAAFQAMYRLEGLRRAGAEIWNDADVLLTPTAGGTFTVDAVEADPIALNSKLGLYTNFMNLLDLAGIAVPAGFGRDGLPFGVTLSAPAGSDAELLAIGDALHRAAALPMGATGHALPAPGQAPDSGKFPENRPGFVTCAMVGAHMAGLPLNGQIVSRRGRLLGEARTAPLYRLHLLDDMEPHRPGLVRQTSGGSAISVELWEIPEIAFGGFVAEVPSPLSIGHIQLADGRSVMGFLCEASAATYAPDISRHGGWRGWLAAKG
ncbi:allophanate hydrolase [Telmatospirillum siberiense]|uniref:Allophanate hydrolase n=2 Tax=Telmatospirillum siberiense TaxID=382514 RepID=A0A2N3PVT5_9PROT|nr:allophanate hydrolase [Telmatospirillum siberiense]